MDRRPDPSEFPSQRAYERYMYSPITPSQDTDLNSYQAGVMDAARTEMRKKVDDADKFYNDERVEYSKRIRNMYIATGIAVVGLIVGIILLSIKNQQLGLGIFFTVVGLIAGIIAGMSYLSNKGLIGAYRPPNMNL